MNVFLTFPEGGDFSSSGDSAGRFLPAIEPVESTIMLITDKFIFRLDETERNYFFEK